MHQTEAQSLLLVDKHESHVGKNIIIQSLNKGLVLDQT